MDILIQIKWTIKSQSYNHLMFFYQLPLIDKADYDKIFSVFLLLQSLGAYERLELGCYIFDFIYLLLVQMSIQNVFY